MDLTNPAPLSLTSLLVNLILGLIMSVILSIYYVKYGRSFSNRRKFAPILPMLSLITLLVISIVKSSLALSLGLVGALSIVRFRTAIKEPEELIYLFFAIAIGLGMGADQRIPTLVAFSFILIGLLIHALFTRKKNQHLSIFLSIQIPNCEDNTIAFDEINEVLVEELDTVDLRRLEQEEHLLQITYYVSANKLGAIPTLMKFLKKQYPQSSLSIIEQQNFIGG